MSVEKLHNPSRKRGNLLVTVFSRTGNSSEIRVTNLRTGTERYFACRDGKVREWLTPGEIFSRYNEEKNKHFSTVSADIFEALINKL